MKQRNKFRLSFALIIISVVITLFSIRDNKKFDKTYLELSSENSALTKKLEDEKSSEKSLKEEISLKKSKIEGIDSEITKFGVMTDKRNKISNMKEELLNTHIKLQENNFDFSYSNFNDTNNIKPLDSYFFDDNMTEEDDKDNIIFLPIALNSYINEDLNYEISRNNFRVVQNLGILDYIENGDNYLVKSILLNDSSNSEVLKKRNNYLLELNKFYLSAYENIFFEKEMTSSYIDNRMKILNSPDYDEAIELETKDMNRINALDAFCIDLLNSSSNHLSDFSISENDGIRQLKRKDFVLMSEKINDKEINLTFFNKNNGKIFEINDKID
ncbi:hypothetical protein [Peptoniphilus sp.]|uniref:hypothetical protein n=1 Tax=Peptoniphilus sp. TaxID=1971214 RepID=UPI003D93F1FA